MTPRTDRTRRFFRSGELPLVLLVLLDERPQHGYELMLELQERFGPAYRASPGSIYPALNALETEHLIIGDDQGDRRVYRLSQEGRDAFTRRRAVLEQLEQRTGARLTKPSAESALARFAGRVRPLVAHVDVADLEHVLDDAAERIERLKKGKP
jgi:DNA-binding PadR family transcriptional regulator